MSEEQKKAAAEKVAAEKVAAEEEAIKALLRRNGLPRAWRDQDGGVHFDAAFITRFDADTLTVIEA
ncbi:hypothetical protein [Hymenobacter sp.]|uniref:hypothetical protein n=1 Tax=Hymenobacter sp. TaxID=1898978 RepID=UPI002869F1E8|nr:hypothetical protein [Hymenobacter sp.]